MAAFFNQKTCYHARSVSLPCASHPLIHRFDEHLCRLKASETTSTSSSSVGNKLSDIKDLYDCVNDVLMSPHTQQALAQECHDKWADDALHGSLKLLDVCSTTKDLLLQTSECTQELQSSLCRRRGGEFGLANEVGDYMNSRKKVRKAIQKSLRDLRSMENKCSFSPLDHEAAAMVNMIREVDTVTITVFQALLSFIAGPNVQSQPSGWSLVSKLMVLKRVACEKKADDFSEFEVVDAILHTIITQKKSKSIELMHVETLQNKLGKLESFIQDLEEGLEALFRILIKTRVSLNLLNH